ncbi:MAG: hypothetical protein M1828_006483 [Chrysothrix sp. TS-e1954]|nr:MAG: hypothetical protein M1828_006483 [Chrysothrix sp. TS-e1954]
MSFQAALLKQVLGLEPDYDRLRRDVLPGHFTAFDRTFGYASAWTGDMRFISNSGSVTSVTTEESTSSSSGVCTEREDDSDVENGHSTKPTLEDETSSGQSSSSESLQGFINRKPVKSRRSPPPTMVAVKRKADKKKLEPSPHQRGGGHTEKAAKVKEPKKPAQSNDIRLTLEQEDKLVALSAEERTWPDIAEELGYEKKDIPKLKACLGKLKKVEPEVKVAEKGKHAKATKHDGGAGSKKGAVKASKAKVLEPDEDWSAEELTNLCDILRKDQDNLWLRIASAYFDQTGEQLHPLDIRDKFAESSDLYTSKVVSSMYSSKLLDDGFLRGSTTWEVKT